MNRYTTTTHRNTKEEPIYIAILTGTIGYREKTKGIKILQNFGNSSLLEHQIKTIRRSIPKSQLCITTGFQSDKIIKIRPENSIIIENQLYDKENTAEELRLLLNVINPSRLLLIDGAIYFCEESIKKIIESSSVIQFDSDDEHEIGIFCENGKVINFSYGLKEKWSGLAYLEGNDLENFKKICIRENSKLCLYEILNILIDKGIPLKAIYSNKIKIQKF